MRGVGISFHRKGACFKGGADEYTLCEAAFSFSFDNQFTDQFNSRRSGILLGPIEQLFVHSVSQQLFFAHVFLRFSSTTLPIDIDVLSRL